MHLRPLARRAGAAYMLDGRHWRKMHFPTRLLQPVAEINFLAIEKKRRIKSFNGRIGYTPERDGPTHQPGDDAITSMRPSPQIAITQHGNMSDQRTEVALF